MTVKVHTRSPATAGLFDTADVAHVVTMSLIDITSRLR